MGRVKEIYHTQQVDGDQCLEWMAKDQAIYHQTVDGFWKLFQIISYSATNMDTLLQDKASKYSEQILLERK